MSIDTTSPKKQAPTWFVILFVLSIIGGGYWLLSGDGSATSNQLVQSADEVDAPVPYFEVLPDSIRNLFKSRGFTEKINDHTGGVYDYELEKKLPDVDYRLILFAHDNGKIRHMIAEVNAHRVEGMVNCEEFLTAAIDPLPGAAALSEWMLSNFNIPKATVEESGTKVTVKYSSRAGVILGIEPV